MEAPELPSRRSLFADRILFCAIGAGFAGLIDAVGAVTNSALWIAPREVAALVVAGLAGGLGLGAATGVVVGIAPARDRGRSRFLAVLVGFFVWWVGAAAAVVLPDPPPFTAAEWWQGSPLAFSGVVAVLAIVLLGGSQVARQPNSRFSLLAALAATQAVWAFPGQEGRAAAAGTVADGPRPNVLLVTLDTTRADRMGAYGNAEIDTRHFDGIAASGVRFTNASAVAAVTGPSHAAMLSGTPPWVNGVLLNGVPVPDDVPLLAERLRAAGYATGAFVSAYVLDGKLGFARGFDVYDDEFGWLRGGSLLMPARLGAMLARRVDPDMVLERRGAETTALALDWLHSQSGPWFAWVHLFDAHGPYTPPPPFDTRYYAGDPTDPAHDSMPDLSTVASYLLPSLQGITDLDYVLAQYAGELSYADAQLGRLVEAAGPDALVAVIGDHGESFGEHGVWFNHGDDVYETSVHVPFAIRWTGHIPAGTVSERPVEGDDLAPTLLARLGLPTDGIRGVDALEGGREEAASMCFDRDANRAERAAGRITDARYRMAAIRTPEERWVHRELSGVGELFALPADPAGLKDVAPEAALAPEGAAAIAAFRLRTAALFAGNTERSSAELAPDERELLERLGYLEP